MTLKQDCNRMQGPKLCADEATQEATESARESAESGVASLSGSESSLHQDVTSMDTRVSQLEGTCILRSGVEMKEATSFTSLVTRCDSA